MSAASAKERAQKKIKRQKQFIAVGSVVLLAILGFEMTKVLPRGEKASTGVTPTTASAAASAPSSPVRRLRDTDRLVIQRNSDQLLSFGLFKSKDPFVQQLSTAPAPASSPATAPPAPIRTTTTAPSKPIGVGLTPATTTTDAAPTPGAPNPPATTETPVTAPTVPATSTTAETPVTTPSTTQAPVTTPAAPGTTSQSTPTAPVPAPTSVLIATNGICEAIALNGTFPGGEDIFRLVSIAQDGKSGEIGVVGGSYDSGQATAALKLGEKLTLVNTADGTRYVIALKLKCDVVAQPARPAGTTPTTTTTPATTPATTPTTAEAPTPVPPAPATTTTTAAPMPIVTDSLDPTAPSG